MDTNQHALWATSMLILIRKLEQKGAFPTKDALLIACRLGAKLMDFPSFVTCLQAMQELDWIEVGDDEVVRLTEHGRKSADDTLAELDQADSNLN